MVETENYKKYLSQLKDVVVKYPNLSIVEYEDRKILKGILDIPNDHLSIVGSYFIEIHYTTGFPFRFPKLYEIGQSIPNHIDWHKFDDHSCCITVLPDEILKCKTQITICEFIENYAFSFFANHVHRKATGRYFNGEYSHGYKGLEEFYSELFKTTDKLLWRKYFDHVFRKQIFPIERNLSCFCKSGMKFKKCHKNIFESAKLIGWNQILLDFKSIMV